MSVDDATWTEIKRLYTETSEPINAIARRHGISDQMIYKRAKAAGWPRRSERKRPSAAMRHAGEAAKRRQPARNAQQSVVRRLYRAIDTKLRKLEKRMQSGEALTAADSERETRELGTMIRSFEKVTEVAADIDRPQESAAAKAPLVTAADAERMREEIAERLERLHAQGPSARGSGEPQ